MKKINRIVFVLDFPFSRRDFDRLGFKYLIEKGINVQSCDLTKIFFKNKIEPSFYFNKMDFQNNFVFDSIAEGNKYFANLSSSDIIISFLDLHLLQKFDINKNVLIGRLDLGGIATPSKNLFDKLIEIKNNPSKLYQVLYRKLAHKSVLSENFKIVAGRKAEKRNKSKSIITHSFDYETFLLNEKNNKTKTTSEPYAVYLDEGMVGHPDYDQLSVEPYASEKIFYSEINSFFYKIKKSLGMNIKICGHPRMKNYSNIDYGKNELFFDKTANLVKNSNLVLAHSSTSVSFAVIYKKPIIFINSKNYSRYSKKHIKFMSSILKSNMIDISKPVAKIDISILNEKAYKNYYKNYINNCSDIKYGNESIWKVFLDEIKHL